MKTLKKYRIEFKEVEYGFVEVEAIDPDEAIIKADDIISEGNANYGKNERIIDDPQEIKKFEFEEDPKIGGEKQ